MSMLCSRCKKRVAVVFMTRMENGKTINEGLCLQCAKELGIGPVNELMEKMGITDDEIENMNDQLMGMIDENGEEIDPDLDPDDPDFVPGGAQTFPFFQNMFGKMNGASGQNPQDPAEKRTRRPEKKGKKEPKVQINYNNNFSWSMASRLPDGVSSDKWIRAMNQANVNNGSGQYFKDEHVQAVDDFIAGRGPSAFYTTDNSITAAGQWAYAGNTDWFDVMYKPSFMQQHNASISGGSDKTTYYGSIGYKGQDGILQYGTDKYKRINMSFNFSTQITKWLEVTFRTKYNRNTSDYPYTSNFNLGNIFYEIYRGFPTIPVYLPDGNNFAGIAGSNFNYNFAGLLDGAGRDKTNSDDFWYTAAFNLTPLAGLSIKGDYTGNKFYQDQTQHGKILYQTMPEESTLSQLCILRIYCIYSI